MTFGANQTQVLLNLSAVTDSSVEGTEGFRVTVLDGGSSYHAGMGSGGSGGSGGFGNTTADVQITDMTFVIGVSGGTDGSGGSGGSASGGTSGGSGGTPTPAQVWVGPASQSVPEGSSGGLWVYRSGGDTMQSLAVRLSIGLDGESDPLATWNTDYSLTGPSGGSGGSSASLGVSGGTVAFGANQTAVFLSLDALSGYSQRRNRGVPCHRSGWWQQLPRRNGL